MTKRIPQIGDKIKLPHWPFYYEVIGEVKKDGKTFIQISSMNETIWSINLSWEFNDDLSKSPVRTVKEIVPGVYGDVWIKEYVDTHKIGKELRLGIGGYHGVPATQEKLNAIINTLTEIRDALKDEKT